MTQYFKQVIYCNDQPENHYNFPSGIKGVDLINGSAFSQYMPLSQLCIQAPPGTKIYFNDDNTPVIIGFTGLFEVNLDHGGAVYKMKFDSGSIQKIKNNNSALAIIDMVYLGGA